MSKLLICFVITNEIILDKKIARLNRQRFNEIQ